MTDRLPPHDVEAERGVLGCLLLDPVACVPICEELAVSAEAFYELKHRTIYDTLFVMSRAGEAIDIITVKRHLEDLKNLEGVGGLAYLATLPDCVPSAANLSSYLQIVREKHELRRLISEANAIVTRAFSGQEAPDLIASEAQQSMQAIFGTGSKLLTVKEAVKLATAYVEERFNSQGKTLPGLSTGLTDLDKFTGGLKAGEMIVIAARPSMGKTSLAMNIAESVAADQGTPVGVFSLEMSTESLVLRMLCARSKLDLRKINDGYMAERDFPKMVTAAVKLANSPLFIDDTGGLTVSQIRGKARRMHQQHGIKLFVVDHLSLVSGGGRYGNRNEEVAFISGEMKALAKELNVPVIVLSQLNRELEKDKNRKPRMSDLRESGAIEQDADLIGFLYKPNFDEDVEENAEVHPVDLLIAKQRNGLAGVSVHLTFFKKYTRFESAAKINPEDSKNEPHND